MLKKTNARAMGNAYLVGIYDHDCIILAEGGVMQITKYLRENGICLYPRISYLHNVEADRLQKTLDTFEIV